MYAITGVTGHVGGAAARELLAAGAPVRAVVRDPEKGQAWAALGAEVAVADFTDRTALAAALAGCRGAFVMLPDHPDRSPTPTTGAWPTRSPPRSRPAASRTWCCCRRSARTFPRAPARSAGCTTWRAACATPAPC